jgi:hypothetical protein
MIRKLMTWVCSWRAKPSRTPPEPKRYIDLRERQEKEERMMSEIDRLFQQAHTSLHGDVERRRVPRSQ